MVGISYLYKVLLLVVVHFVVVVDQFVPVYHSVGCGVVDVVVEEAVDLFVLLVDHFEDVKNQD